MKMKVFLSCILTIRTHPTKAFMVKIIWFGGRLIEAVTRATCKMISKWFETGLHVQTEISLAQTDFDPIHHVM